MTFLHFKFDDQLWADLGYSNGRNKRNKNNKVIFNYSGRWKTHLNNIYPKLEIKIRFGSYDNLFVLYKKVR